ncbi:hypothetical protein BT96DRAFT_822751 [Gymnopus androsaceus JB14]|uniref:Uncharacterized protein n=1 Tax=Gymnopus androsaceus JB14 TaxID=1447944 RepID=A0A6A4HIE2_9AGAR|nr:hypothetical protein BT96DRAFT_822751 [Gymnopus androsaceus JB14]
MYYIDIFNTFHLGSTAILSCICSLHKQITRATQGQSVKQVELNLQSPVYTHGQLFVALSHSTTKQGGR